METLSFAFGMLAMVAVALVTVVVLGMVKVFKMQKQMTTLGQWMERSDSSLHQRISDGVDTFNRVREDDRKGLIIRIDDVYRYADSRFDKMENKLNTRFESAREVLVTKGILND